MARKATAPEETQPRTRPAVWKIALGVVTLVGALASPFWGPPLLAKLAFFRIRKVEILGARYTPTAEVLERLAVDTNRSVWDPLGPLSDRVRAHPQVARVAVTRKLPGTIVVDITERRPVALIPGEQGLHAVDEEGRPLPLDPSITPVNVPIVTTTPRDTSVYHLLGALQRQSPQLYSQVNTITRAGPGELVLRIGNLPVRAMTNVSLARLSDIEPVARDLARRQVHPTELDLRYHDQVIARLP